MMKAALCVVVLFLITQGFASEEKIYCVKLNSSSSETGNTSCSCQEYTDWSAVISNSSHYFASYTKICFTSDNINLSKKISIVNATNISIIGFNSVKSTSISCSNNSFVFVSNVTFLQIQNFELEACGSKVQKYIEHYGAHAALLLDNVRSATISNVVFKNSYGHSIIGNNLMGSTVLQQVSVVYVNDSSMASRALIGGIILIFSDEITKHSNHSQQRNILIERCQVYYMNNTRQEKMSSSKLSKAVRSLALGFNFYQQNYAVSINIVKTNITSITAQNGPLIYILYNSSNVSNVTLFKSNILHNIITEYGLIEINVGRSNGGSCKSVRHFEVRNCRVSNNIAKSVYNIKQQSQPLCQIVMHIKTVLTTFAHNQAKDYFWMVSFKNGCKYSPTVNILIKQCTFLFNSGFNIEFYKAGNVLLVGKNIFTNNVLNKVDQPKAILTCYKTKLTFEEYSEFSFNTAYWILTLTNYIMLRGNAIINITQNSVVIPYALEGKSTALIYFESSNNDHLCKFQFLSKSNSSQTVLYENLTDYFAIFFEDNTNYSSLIFGTQLNSCFWLKDAINFADLTTGDVMKSVLKFNKTSKQVIQRNITTLCYCKNNNNEDCITDYFRPIFPGQMVPINLKQVPYYSNISTHIYSFAVNDDVEQCPMKPYQLNWLQSINSSCIPIKYAVYSKSSPENTRCYVSFKTTSPDDSLYIYYIDINEACPLGFSLIDGSCECDSRLKTAIPTITCDINTQTFSHSEGGWIGLSEEGDILYVRFCAPTFCIKESTNIHLNSPDTQCNYNRGGLACGQCPPDLSAVFGSLRCKRCTNQWLLLIFAFMLAGILLILLLFALNLTIADGKINGFIFYANGIIANMHAMFLPSSDGAKVISLLNLDLGIETCFYDGMTEYDKTWLQFVFPLYLLFIVAMLAFASRYFSVVEKLTRRRVIPVIATIVLLSYNKLLLVTTEVLFSYTTMYNLSNNKKMTIWMWDTGITLFGVEFSILFIASLLLILIALLPLIFSLLFTRFSLRIRFLSKYLKPYLDAFQGPFKDTCRYFPGLELICRCIAFAVGSRFLKPAHQRAALSNFICVFLLVYVGTFKPFKSLINTALYISYVINLQFIVTLVLYSDFDITENYFTIILHVLLFIAIAEFVGTVLYYCYISQLHKIKCMKLLASKINNVLFHCYHKFKVSHTFPPSSTSEKYYEQLQEEMLLANPLQ